MRPFYHKVNIDGMWICQFVELLIIRHAIKENQELQISTTNASLCSSSETVRDLSIADNGKKQWKQLIDIHEYSSFNQQKKRFKGAGYWELLYNVKSLFSTLFLCQMQIIKC